MYCSRKLAGVEPGLRDDRALVRRPQILHGFLGVRVQIALVEFDLPKHVAIGSFPRTILEHL
jgi:hypothetical protein